MNAINEALSNFKECACNAPPRTYEAAKELDGTIGHTCDELIKAIKAIGLKADTCDLIFHVEATIYDYVKKSNPDSTLFPIAEGFGASMGTCARQRIIDQAAASRDGYERAVAMSR